MAEKFSFAEVRTPNGYQLGDVTSALQKAVRRGDSKLAGWFANEIFKTGYKEYVWKRLLTFSAEDCAGVITKEIVALYEAYHIINKGKARQPEHTGMIFITKAVILLCECRKSREADHLLVLSTWEGIDFRAGEVEDWIREATESGEIPEIPDYAYDIHTAKGRYMRKTKAEFFTDEHEALEPRIPGRFDHLPEAYAEAQRLKKEISPTGRRRLQVANGTPAKAPSEPSQGELFPSPPAVRRPAPPRPPVRR